MALTSLHPLKSPIPKPSSHHSPSTNPQNSIPNSSSSFLQSLFFRRRHGGAITLQQPSCYGDNHYERTSHSRPLEIPWRKDMANFVQLIGTIGASVQIKQLSSGKVFAWTRLGFWKSPSETSWINLNFWDDLANMAFQHAGKGDRVYVSGRLVSDTTEGENEKSMVFYKVVVQQLNFIKRSFSQVSLCDQVTETINSGMKNEKYADISFTLAPTELWQAFFANPVDWWDNRKTKKNSKYPDFKHKHTDEALWIEGKDNPSWVKGQLAILDERMSSFHPHTANSDVSLLNGNDFTPL